MKLFKIIFTPESEAVRLAITLLLLLIVVALVIAAESGRSYVEVVGPEEIVFNWSRDACEASDIPDVPARAFRDAQDRVQLIASRHVNRRMIGPNLNNLKRDCSVIKASHYDPDPAKFNDYEWIHSVYTVDGATIFALVHNEYQGHAHPNQCPSNNYWQCWYNSIMLAISTDMGVSYHHAPPPAHLVASIPYRYEPDSGPMGIFNPSNIVFNAVDGYYYALLRVQRYQAQPRGTCVMRTTNLADPKSWRAWDGRGFNVRFINPYLESEGHTQNHICQPVSHNEIQQMVDSLTFNTYFNRFLLIGTASEVVRKGKVITGIYFSLSDDLIHWTPRKLIFKAELPWSFECGDPDPVNYSSLLDPNSPSRNFETTGKRAYLYFTRFNYVSCQMRGADLVRIPIEFFQ